MFVLTQLNINQRQRLWVLMDTHTCLPLLYPLQYLTDHLASRSLATQSSSLQALKFFYEFWYRKHGVTFCYSFYSSDHNPLIVIEELTPFFHYLDNGYSCTPVLTIGSAHTRPRNRTNARHMHAVIKFCRYLTSLYVSPRYMDGSPAELTRLATRIAARLSMYKDELRALTHSRLTKSSMRFRSLTAEMVLAFYRIITPSSAIRINTFNPFPAGEQQLRNFLICRLLLNYGLRVSELLLLECNSIKHNIRGDQFSLIVTTVNEEVFDPRKRLPSLKNVYANRVLAIDKSDYDFLSIYINKIRQTASHDFLFTSTGAQNPPLSYHAVYDIFTRIDCVINEQYPEFKNTKYYDSIDRVSPHIARHTWAWMTLQKIYCDKLQKVKAGSRHTESDLPVAGLMNEAKDELRLLGGWNHNSRMPDLYAKRYLSQEANNANLHRISMDNSDLSEMFYHLYTEWNL